jgi:hypothetical protein
LTRLERRFGLSSELGSGIWCSENGVFVGSVPLLQRVSGQSGPGQWHPRPVSELNRDLSECYGLPIEFTPKIGGLTAACRALNRGDLLHAQIVTIHLQIPDPPALTKLPQNERDLFDLVRQLRASGLLKADWDSSKHPRWPAGSVGGIGGEFAPGGATAGTTATDSPTAEQSTPVIPAQITIPAPLELPEVIPFPSEILPPIAIPDTNPRELKNPYPDRPECKREWAEAIKKCRDMVDRGQFRRDDYRGMGEFFYQCVMGHVSADCGGNQTGA